MKKSPRFCRTLVVIAAASVLLTGRPRVGAQDHVDPPIRVIELLADHDSRYKIAGESTPEITVKAENECFFE
jgi:hypothetical protein